MASHKLIQCYVGVALFIMHMQAKADGMIDVNPYVTTGITYDDNIFRQSQNASNSLQSDVIKTIGAGLSTNLHLSRQLISFTANLNKNTYKNNTFLDNDNQALRLSWNWRLGSKLYGEISANKNEAISGFDNNTARLKNIQTIERKLISINWNVVPNWTIYGIKSISDAVNDNAFYQQFDRDDNNAELGLRFANELGTQLNLFYRNTDSEYRGRNNSQAIIFGSQSTQNQYGVDFAWLATAKMRLSGQVSKTTFNRIDALQDDFSGFNQRINLTYLASVKTNIGVSVYKEASQVDGLLTNYVETEGVNLNATWATTSKLTMTLGAGIQKRDFLTSSGIATVNDETLSLNSSIVYRPIDEALIKMQYNHQKRNASSNFFEFEFNQINVIGQYFF